ncbi:L-threonylcarbamoyladenylate synthase [Desulfonauticus submarinus]|uniref:L-threonylcarbamoyladenylate synthase n=1 Tax=Desulfonauticus submarinus TaxID=206665 RepID=A0A1H0E8M2_9BACT|nr:L-threonylcarbamoyladenylate synthase [Desulfonauticus submarinus]SDN78787.1 L-threonylcarbamoyladenylate synthase [Desulfonauticus submarinus]
MKQLFDLKSIACLLNQDKIGLIPTETLWGLTCNPFSQSAVQKIFFLKKRPNIKPLPLVAGSLEQVLEHVNLSQKMLNLVAHFWPGPLSVVTTSLADFVKPGIKNEYNEVCIRVTSHSELANLCLEAKIPLVATSANLSGKKSPKKFEEIDPFLIKGVDFVFRSSYSYPLNAPSTIIKAEKNHLLFLRLGAISKEEIFAYWQKV